MGIKNGAPDIIAVIRHGVFNKNAKNYKIIVDGELMRYKGMIEANLCKHNAEEAIAATSFDYMKNIILQLELFIGKRAQDVIVFMDGSRVFNKESGRGDFKFDANLIRRLFKSICFQYGYTVNELIHGESELQMYLQRDKTIELNVFLTNDSDMISICYGHVPTLEYIDDGGDSVEDLEPADEAAKVLGVTEFQNLKAIDGSSTAHEIVDGNRIYNLQKVKVTDSCLWINSGKTITAIGFDFIETRIHFGVLAFRTFVAFCGTDFTGNLLTDSMISAVLLADKEDIAFVNTLVDINDIAGCLLVLGLRSKGTIKRFDAKAKNDVFSADDISTSTEMYLNYIASGKMANVEIARPNMGLACRHYLYALRGQDLCFAKAPLIAWALKTPLREAVDNIHRYLGTFNPAMAETKAPACPRKRKADAVVTAMPTKTAATTTTSMLPMATWDTTAAAQYLGESSAAILGQMAYGKNIMSDL